MFINSNTSGIRITAFEAEDEEQLDIRVVTGSVHVTLTTDYVGWDAYSVWSGDMYGLTEAKGQGNGDGTEYGFPYRADQGGFGGGDGGYGDAHDVGSGFGSGVGAYGAGERDGSGNGVSLGHVLM